MNRPLNFSDPTGHKQACADGDEGGKCGYGANTEQIYKLFSKKRGSRRDGLFAAYFATLHAVTLAKLRDDPYLQDYIDSANAQKQIVESWLPQKDFNPVDLVNPAEIYGLAQAITDFGSDFVSGGVAVAGILLPAPKGSRGRYLSPYGFPDLSKEPAEGFAWKGSSSEPGSPKGSWYNENTNEYLRYDPYHHGTPHVDYRAPDGTEFWIWPDGSMTLK